MSDTPSRICRTPEESAAAGWNAPCEHGVPDPTQCPGCRLTEAEIYRLALLLRPYLVPAEEAARTSAA
jgi:hypothetical protein